MQGETPNQLLPTDKQSVPGRKCNRSKKGGMAVTLTSVDNDTKKYTHLPSARKTKSR